MRRSSQEAAARLDYGWPLQRLALNAWSWRTAAGVAATRTEPPSQIPCRIQATKHIFNCNRVLFCLLVLLDPLLLDLLLDPPLLDLLLLLLLLLVANVLVHALGNWRVIILTLKTSPVNTTRMGCSFFKSGKELNSRTTTCLWLQFRRPLKSS